MKTMMEEERKFLGVGKNVFSAGLVSFFMDVSSEMIYPLVPLFLANVLGAEKSLIGLIEGIAEATASLLKVFSGWFSDRIGNRKGLMAAGYAISTLSRPFVALAAGWQAVLGSRFMDRFGKGIRTSPRDALIAESTDRKFLGRAFGFHRSMDTMGAVVGPGLAFFLLWIFSNDYRKVFWLSMVPGLFAVLLIIFFITEKKSRLPRDSERPKLMKIIGDYAPVRWRTAAELWMILYLTNAKRTDRPAQRNDLIAWLQACRNGDGGFGFLPGTASFIENCHTCLRALALLGAKPLDIDGARAFILACRTGTGGFARIQGATAFLDATWHAVASLSLLAL